MCFLIGVEFNWEGLQTISGNQKKRGGGEGGGGERCARTAVNMLNDDTSAERVWEGNMGLYVHRNHSGLLGTGKLGEGGAGIFISNTYSLPCHHQNDSALRWAAV